MRRSRSKSESILPAPKTTDDTAVENVGGELRRNTLERIVDRLNDRAHRFAQRLPDLLVVHRHGLGAAFHQMAALDFHRLPLLERESGADLDLDLLSGALADQKIVRLTRVQNDRLVEL